MKWVWRRYGSSVRNGGWSLSSLAMRGGKKGTWKATPGKPKDEGLGFVSSGSGKRINGGDGWIGSEGWESNGEVAQ